MKLTKEDVSRFWAKVDIRSEDECWEWKAFIRPDGYGAFNSKLKTKYAHRISYFIENGKLSKYLNVLHKCNNRKCVNPNHLYEGTQKQNVQDSINSGTFNISKFGESAPNSRLTFSSVERIRELLEQGIKQTEIAKMFSVSKSTINAIKFKRTWRQ